ncbi:MAG TPA: protein kinase [Thermoanaerobaculaceae bacterium]|nr:protein kinase [Thermoanaerobaculaceae bacterium]HRS17362.1 protein kinase [Thermoanaerobaculaceae bacterium]
MLEAGRIVGHFELVGLLGRGGMGEVWRARDLTLGREVALKVLPERLADDPDYVGRFEHEARVLAALNHPHVAQIFELEEALPGRPGGPLHVIVMELVEGDTLAGRLEQGPLLAGEAVRIALQVARALGAAHARGVVHRDLKPSNIAFDAEGNAKVLDFGLARLTPPWRAGAEVEDTAKLADSGVVAGTAAYMAPEQIRGEVCDARCDVWAFGCTLAEMLSGQRLVPGASVPEIAGNVLTGRLAWETLPRSLPRRLVRLIRDCVQADRRRRPDMSELEARLAGLASRAPRWRRRLVAGAAVVAALVLLALAFRLSPPPPPRLGADGRLPVAVDELPASEATGAAAGLARSELLRGLAASAALEVVPLEAAMVRVRSELLRAGGAAHLHLTVEDVRSRAMLGAFDLPLAVGGGANEAAAAVVAALELEQVGRELERDDPYYGFLVRRTQVLGAAQAFRDGLRLTERTRNREAREAFERAAAADPAFWPAPMFLALLAKANARFDEGHALMARARGLVPRPRAAEAVILEAGSAHIAEDNQRALETLQRTLKLFPGSGYLAFRTAQSLRLQDRPEDAIPLVEKLLDRGWRPDWSPTLELLAHCQLLAGQHRAVLLTCAAGEDRFPTRHRYPFFAACALQQLGRPDEARQALQRAVRKYLDYSGTAALAVHQTAQYWAALLRWPEERRRQWEGVLAEAENGLHEQPGDPALEQARAEALVELGRAAEAEPILRALASQPEPPVYALLALARLQHASGDDAQARVILARAADIWRAGHDPARGTLAYNVATVWALLGDTEQALEWLLRARDLYGVDRLDLAMDPDLDSLRAAGLLRTLPPRRPTT